MSKFQNLMNSLKATVNLFYVWKIPCGDVSPRTWLFPLAGVIPGCLISVFSAALVNLLGNVTGGVVSAILGVLLLELLTGWRGVDALTSFLEQRLSGVPFEESLAVPAPRGTSRQAMMLFFSVYGLRMLAFGVLAGSGSAVWLIFSLGGGYFIREILAETGEFHAPFLKRDEAHPHAGLLLFACSTLIAALLALHFSALSAWIVAVMTAALIAFCVRKIVLSSLGAANRRVIDIFGAASELILLYIGLMLSGGF